MNEKKINLLLVEDEQMLAEILSDTLTDKGFNVRTAYDGLSALERWRKERAVVIVTDVMMPKMDGYSLVKALRAEGCDVPILFLTARSATEDVVNGFEVGANDFLRKPFAIDELIARLNALAGRKQREQPSERLFSFGSYEFYPTESKIHSPRGNISLSAREAQVLLRLCRNMNDTVSAESLLKELWGDDSFYNLRSLNVFISRLRKHLEEDESVEIINIRGVGYKLKC